MCILCVFTLLKVFGDYDLNVLSMSVMGFPKKIGWGCVGGVSSIQVFFWIFGIAKSLSHLPRRNTRNKLLRTSVVAW